MPCSGLKLARRRPNECSFCNHWVALTSVLRPGIFFASQAFNEAHIETRCVKALKSRQPVNASGLHGDGRILVDTPGREETSDTGYLRSVVCFYRFNF
jgi:hypothetical protein